MPKTKTPAKLTVTQATSQARRHVDKLMPGVMATVESRYSWNLAEDRQIVITTVTFSGDHPNRSTLYGALSSLPGVTGVRTGWARFVVTREV